MSNFTEVDQVREGEVVAVITEHNRTGLRTFMLSKEFLRDGEIVRSSFLGKRHIDSLIELLGRLRETL